MSEQSNGTGATEIWKVRVEKNSGADTYRVIRINDVGVRLGATPQGPWVSAGYYCFGSKEIAEAYAQNVATSRGYTLCAFAFSEDDAWVESSSNPCQLNSPAPAKGVAVVEYVQSYVFEVDGQRFCGAWFVRMGDMFYGAEYPHRWYNDSCLATAFFSCDIAEAVAAALNARNAKPSLADRIADADTARDAKVSARLAADMGVSNEVAAEVAKAFKPFADMKDRIEKHRKELDERLNGMENDARDSRQLVANQINSIQRSVRDLQQQSADTSRRIDRLKVIDPGHH